MKQTVRASQRLVAGAALAAAAILIPGAALAASAASASGARTAAASAPACRAASTEVWLALPGEGTAGTVYYQLEFSTVGRHTCTLFGHPGVSAVNRNGHQVGKPASWGGVPHPVTLQPGATSHVILGVVDTGAVCANPITAASLRVYPPGQTHAQHVELSVRVCPSRSTMNVSPVRPGTGIPFYTTY